jgi:hypothetical protein
MVQPSSLCCSYGLGLGLSPIDFPGDGNGNLVALDNHIAFGDQRVVGENLHLFIFKCGELDNGATSHLEQMIYRHGGFAENNCKLYWYCID